MNRYELTLVLDGKAGAAKKKKVIETVEGLVKVFDGKIISAKDWGVKDLAYPLRGGTKTGKSTSGLYLFFELELESKAVKGINDKLRVNTDLLRYLLVRNG